MSLVFNTVDEADFVKIGEKPEFMKIEEALVEIGGGGVAGMNYKKQLVKQGGWRYPALTSYAKNPKLAAEVFNRIRDALTQTNSRDELLKLVTVK